MLDLSYKKTSKEAMINILRRMNGGDEGEGI
jgi:hypothetical protein